MLNTHYSLIVTLSLAWTVVFSLTDQPGWRRYRRLGMLASYGTVLTMPVWAGVLPAVGTWLLFSLIGGIGYTVYDFLSVLQLRRQGATASPSIMYLYKAFVAWPLMIPECIEYALSDLGVLKHQSPRQDTGPVIVPSLKPEHFRTAWEGGAVPAEQTPVMEPFLPGILLTYSVDCDGESQPLTHGMLAELGLPQTDVRERSLKRLWLAMRHMKVMTLQECADILIVQMEGDLEACLMLDERFWSNMAAETGGRLMVGVPAQNALLFTSREEEAVLTRLRGLVQAVFEKNGARGISDRLWLWEDGAWGKYEAEETAG